MNKNDIKQFLSASPLLRIQRSYKLVMIVALVEDINDVDQAIGVVKVNNTIVFLVSCAIDTQSAALYQL